jgi:site-specific DNA-methyltransferase (adenine-specific)
MDVNVLYNEDCLLGMRRIPDGSVDMILCDLPYGTTACKWDAVIPFEPLWEQYRRITKKNAAIVLTASQPFTSKLVSSNLPWFRYEWVWEKTQAVGHLNAYKMPLRAHENILVFGMGRLQYNPQLQEKPRKNIRPITPRTRGTDCYGEHGLTSERKIPLDKMLPTSAIRFPNEQRTVHPTQKPVSLFEYLIRTYTNEGETVLDNCMGSGTTAIACLNTGRNYIGFEKDPGYFETAQKRIAAHKPQLSLMAG